MMVATSSAGLSPRVRGNQFVGVGGVGADGSIPACAGEPDIIRHCDEDYWVYPRVCGGTKMSARA